MPMRKPKGKLVALLAGAVAVPRAPRQDIRYFGARNSAILREG